MPEANRKKAARSATKDSDISEYRRDATTTFQLLSSHDVEYASMQRRD